MSIQNRRRAFLGFGVLAAVLIVAVIAIWPPQIFDQDAATGAIGAVEKHREQQIAPQDVVLGDEATRREQQVVFAHYLNDAAKLHAVSAELAARSEARSRAQAGAKELASINAEMQARFVQNVDFAVAAIEQLLAGDAQLQARLASELADIGARARNPQLAAHEGHIELLSARLKNVAEQLAIAPCCSGRGQMDARNLASAEQMMARATAPLQAKACCSNEALAAAAADVDQGVRALNARFAAANYADFTEYLNDFALQVRAIANIEEQLAAAVQLQNEEQLAARINNLSEALAVQAFTLEARAMSNLEQQLASDVALAGRLRSIEAMVASNRAAANRASLLRNDSMESFNRAMQNFVEALASRSREFQARAAANIESQLSSFDSYLQARREVHSRMLNARPAYAARLANVDSIEAHMANVDQALEARAPLAAYLANSVQLEARARDLRSRAGNLN